MDPESCQVHGTNMWT